MLQAAALAVPELFSAVEVTAEEVRGDEHGTHRATLARCVFQAMAANPEVRTHILYSHPSHDSLQTSKHGTRQAMLACCVFLSLGSVS